LSSLSCVVQTFVRLADVVRAPLDGIRWIRRRNRRAPSQTRRAWLGMGIAV